MGFISEYELYWRQRKFFFEIIAIRAKPVGMCSLGSQWPPNKNPESTPATNIFFKKKIYIWGVFCEICNQSKTCWNSFIGVPIITKKKNNPPLPLQIFLFSHIKEIYMNYFFQNTAIRAKPLGMCSFGSQ